MSTGGVHRSVLAASGRRVCTCSIKMLNQRIYEKDLGVKTMSSHH